MNDHQSWKSCSICSNVWNRKDHVPVVLPACGHSFCRHCLATVYKNDKCIKCPTCRKEYKDVKPDELAPNYALLELLDAKGKDGASPSPGPESRNETPPKNEPSNEESSGTTPSNKGSGIAKGILCAGTAVVGGVGLVAATPAILTAVGFTSAGIAAGSLAASMMSAAASLGGGGVAAGGVIATLQSVGAVGLGATGVAAVGAAGGAAGAGVGYAAAKVAENALHTEGLDWSSVLQSSRRASTITTL